MNENKLGSGIDDGVKPISCTQTNARAGPRPRASESNKLEIDDRVLHDEAASQGKNSSLASRSSLSKPRQMSGDSC